MIRYRPSFFELNFASIFLKYGDLRFDGEKIWGIHANQKCKNPFAKRQSI
jgi:hypothetical protein